MDNSVIIAADATKAFGETDGPEQQYYIEPDSDFHNWWKKQLHKPPIPHGYVIPVMKNMQGHPEAPRLWSRHIDCVIQKYDMHPTRHEPCLYYGICNGFPITLPCQVDDFSVAAPDEQTANILLDQIFCGSET